MSRAVSTRFHVMRAPGSVGPPPVSGGRGCSGGLPGQAASSSRRATTRSMRESSHESGPGVLVDLVMKMGERVFERAEHDLAIGPRCEAALDRLAHRKILGDRVVED